jgi:hypothetical protein
MDPEQETIVGNVTLFKDAIREQKGSSRKLVKDCKTEDERVDMLKEIYGIELTEEERQSISPDTSIA